MRHLPRHPHLDVQLRQARGIPIDLLGQELQRDGLPQLEVVGPIDFTHPAPTQSPDDAIASVEQGTWREAAVIDCVGARQPAAALRRGLCVPCTNGRVADRGGHLAIGTRQTCDAGRPREGRCTPRADVCTVGELGGAGRTGRHRGELLMQNAQCRMQNGS